jgi:uncharacterized protein
MEIVKTKIASSKGRLDAAIHYPDKKTGKLAILCTGYLDSKDYEHWINLADALCTQGYAVVRFDPTGTWDSEGEISEYNTTQYLEDIKNILDYMLRQANYRSILLCGHSRGGQVAILYAARDPRITMVLGLMPSSKRTTKMGHRYKEWMEKGVAVSYRTFPGDKNRKKEFRVPYSHAVDKDKYDVLEEVKRIKVPVILVAGGSDVDCPKEIVKEIFDNANEPKKFIVMPDIEHYYFYSKDNEKIVNKKVLELIKASE